jgi:hypothetical protein
MNNKEKVMTYCMVCDDEKTYLNVWGVRLGMLLAIFAEIGSCFLDSSRSDFWVLLAFVRVARQSPVVPGGFLG